MKKTLKRIINQFPLLSATVYRLLGKKIRGFDPNSARYCYSVWLRHMVIAQKNGFPVTGGTVAELGPGDSLGVGISALLCGAEKYYAFDVVKHVNAQKNVDFFDQLVELFKKRENIPDENEFPEVKPCLDSYDFPKYILTDELLSKTLREDRIKSIRNTLVNLKSKDKKIQIEYFVPWDDPKILDENSIDLILSQAVLEYVENLPFTYGTMYRWLKSGGLMSHTIDFRSHGTARKWNGHWARSDFVWNWMRGKINRQPHSTYLNLSKKYGFKIMCDIVDKNTSGINRQMLSSRFKNISNDDLTTSGTFIQAVKS